jgi:sentrin-specific protease 1
VSQTLSSVAADPTLVVVAVASAQRGGASAAPGRYAFLFTRCGLDRFMLGWGTPALRTNWLSDDCIYAVLLLHAQRARRVRLAMAPGAASRPPSVLIFFSNSTAGARFDSSLDYAEWLTRDLWLIPIVAGGHWTIGVLNFREKRWEHMDSGERGHAASATSGTKWRGRVEPRIIEQLSLAGIDNPFEGWAPGVHDWGSVLGDDFPRQDNGYDCGVFVCLYGLSLMWGRAPTGFCQALMPVYRQQLAYECLRLGVC